MKSLNKIMDLQLPRVTTITTTTRLAQSRTQTKERTIEAYYGQQHHQQHNNCIGRECSNTTMTSSYTMVSNNQATYLLKVLCAEDESTSSSRDNVDVANHGGSVRVGVGDTLIYTNVDRVWLNNPLHYIDNDRYNTYDVLTLQFEDKENAKKKTK